MSVALTCTSRLQVDLAPGLNTIAHGLYGFTDPQVIMVIPLVPLSDWWNVDIVGQPSNDTVVLENLSGELITLNVEFRYPHSILGVAVADPY